VSQIHLENGMVSGRINLGAFAGSNSTFHVYSGGSGNRRTVVHFVCDASASVPKILRTAESSPLNYELYVGVKSACYHSEAMLDSIPCLDHFSNSLHYRLCPGRTVTELGGNGQVGNIRSLGAFSKREASFGRKIEWFENGHQCESDSTLQFSSRIIYVCLRTKKDPTVLFFAKDTCTISFRIGWLQLCNTMLNDIECFKV